GPQLQADHLVHFVSTCGQDDDRKVRVALMDRPTNVEPTDARQHEIKQNQVRTLSGQLGQRLWTAARFGDLETLLLPGETQAQAHGRVVLDDEDAGRPQLLGRSGHGSATGDWRRTTDGALGVSRPS